MLINNMYLASSRNSLFFERLHEPPFHEIKHAFDKFVKTTSDLRNPIVTCCLKTSANGHLLEDTEAVAWRAANDLLLNLAKYTQITLIFIYDIETPILRR